MNKELKLTITMLKNMGACEPQKDLFRDVFPRGGEINRDNVIKGLEIGLNLHWLSKYIMPYDIADKFFDSADSYVKTHAKREYEKKLWLNRELRRASLSEQNEIEEANGNVTQINQINSFYTTVRAHYTRDYNEFSDNNTKLFYAKVAELFMDTIHDNYDKVVAKLEYWRKAK